MGNLSKKHVAIIGAGPAGLFAAEYLAKTGVQVTVYEQKPTAARKFLMAGRGGLNITHSEAFPDFMARYGDASRYLAPAISAFTPQDMRNWCHALGEETFIGSSGRVFPKSFKASPLLRAWLSALERNGVRVLYQHRWVGISKDGGLMFDHDGGVVSVRPDACLLALGGASWPRLGSDAEWVNILRGAGVKITPFVPANCGFMAGLSDFFREKYAGAPLKAIEFRFGGVVIKGDAMITRTGIEGGAIYALSSALRREIERAGEAILYLDLRPDFSLERVLELFSRPVGRESLTTYLRKTLGLPPVSIGLLQEDRELSRLLPKELAARIKSYPLVLTATAGIDRAISSAGGLSFDELDGEYMIKKLPGVFAAGEMLDWEAPTEITFLAVAGDPNV